jgi:hypothetical protein
MNRVLWVYRMKSMKMCSGVSASKTVCFSVIMNIYIMNTNGRLPALVGNFRLSSIVQLLCRSTSSHKCPRPWLSASFVGFLDILRSACPELVSCYPCASNPCDKAPNLPGFPNKNWIGSTLTHPALSLQSSHFTNLSSSAKAPISS